MTANDIIKIAQSEIGTKESPSNSNNVKYNTWYYGKAVSGSAYPWCAVFVSWLFKSTSLIKKTASCMNMAQWFKDNNRFYTIPQIGDVVFYKFGTNNRWTNHTGIVEKVNSDGSITTIEGNTSTTSDDNGGCVMERTRNSCIIGYGRPNYEQGTATVVDSATKVIDVSHHNTVTNWDKLAQERPNIIIRIGYRGSSNGKITLDNKFVENITQAENRNMNVGIYFYDQSINEAEAQEQAVWVVSSLKNYKITYPIYIDSEYANKKHNGRADGISKEQRTKNIITFCNIINNNGYKAGVYASQSWFNSMVDFNSIKDYEIWCAKYSTEKPSISKYEAWQYGSENYTWASAAIDTSYFYKTYNDTNTVVVNTNTTTADIPYVTYGKITAHSLNIRNKPTTASNIIGHYSNNDYVQILTKNGTWFKTDKGYISSKYVTQANGVIVNCKALNMRKTNISTDKGNIICSLPVNTILNIVQAINGWYLVAYGNVQAYCSSKYVKLL